MYVVLRKDSGLWHTQCEGTDLEYWRYLWLLKCVVVNVLKYTEVPEHLFSRGYEYWGL